MSRGDESEGSSRPRSLLVAAVLVSPWCFWAVLAALFAGSPPGPFRIVAVLGSVLAIAVLGWFRGLRPALGAALLACLVVTGGFAMIQPRHDRQWTEDQSRMPDVAFDGSRFTVTDLRTFRYRSTDDWDASWTTATYDLDELVGVDLGIEHFSSIEAVAHTFASFRFSDGRVLVASVEIRKEHGEAFSPLRGLFRNYELMIVLGDERDLVELRAVHRNDTVYLLPIDRPRDRIAAFLEAVLREADRLHDEPTFYNTLTASCSSTLATLLTGLEPVGWDLRMFAPGTLDDLAYEWGWLEGEGDLDTLRARHTIDDLARGAAGAEDFSARIRAGR